MTIAPSPDITDVIDLTTLSVADLLVDNTVWLENAACQDAAAELFDEVSDPDAIAAAKAWCAECPVAAQCLQRGLDVRGHGTWGGHTLMHGRLSD